MKEIIVYDKPSGGTPLKFNEDSLVESGGEGAVYAVSLSGKKIAIKLFNERKLQKEGGYLAQKITDMVKLGCSNNNELINFPKIAWPQISVYDGSGKFVGYGMRFFAKGTTMSRLAHLPLYKDKKYFPDMDREKVAKILIDVWKSASFLHERGICIGDINLNNVLCTKNYGICWIDADSFQIEKIDKSGKWRCLVGRPDMIPPEHSGKSFKDIDRTLESDLFSLAILSFQCLMLGRHPYDHIGGGDMSDTMHKGYFPYVTGGAYPGKPGGIPKGPWHIMWSHYTYGLKNLFVRALKDGARNPSARPLADEWVKGLRLYLKTLNFDKPATTADGGTFRHTREMIPAEEKPKLEPRGLRTSV